MTREIRFRAWDKRTKQFVRDWFLDGAGDVFQDGRAVEDGITTQTLDLQQFTGLKDKNGKEIYDGDIVQASDGVWTVELVDLESGIILNNDERQETSVNFVDGEYSLRETVVIGNIYENPELLK